MKHQIAYGNLCYMLALCVLYGVAASGNAQAQATTIFRDRTAAPIRLGNAAQNLSTRDIEAINSALPDGRRLWLAYSDSDGPVDYLPPARPPVLAYLTPDTITPTVIRGQRILLRQIAPQKWFIVNSSQYAQVLSYGKTWDSLDWTALQNRPFSVSSDFENGEIVRIVAFIRDTQQAEPRVRVSRRIYSNAPVRAISRQQDRSLMVDMSDSEWGAERVILKQEGETWVVVQAYSWVA